MKARAHIIVSGRVQGVFFRARTREKAQGIGVAGWVRNLRDGRVEAVFEGEREAVEKMIRFCEVGSSGALVKNVEVQWETYTGEYDSFTIV